MFCFLWQIVDGKLFTGSHDATLRVWDITGIKEQAAGTKDDQKDRIISMNGDTRPASKQNDVTSNGQTRIMIDDDEPANGHAQTNGSAQLGVHLDDRNRENDRNRTARSRDSRHRRPCRQASSNTRGRCKRWRR